MNDQEIRVGNVSDMPDNEKQKATPLDEAIARLDKLIRLGWDSSDYPSCHSTNQQLDWVRVSDAAQQLQAKDREVENLRIQLLSMTDSYDCACKTEQLLLTANKNLEEQVEFYKAEWEHAKDERKNLELQVAGLKEALKKIEELSFGGKGESAIHVIASTAISTPPNP